jgi:hypothetical protein
MRINIDKNVVEFIPENQQETASLEVLWRMVLDCAGGNNKSLSPIGEYVPQKENLARFVIEGAASGKTVFSEMVSEAECTYLCTICNKYIHIHVGQAVPYCCGRLMEPVD